MQVRRSALVDRPAELLFDLIEAAEHYPQFLPWCTGASIVSRDEQLVSADLRMRIGGVAFELRTRNPKRRPHHMTIHLERGPFRRFEGEWRLQPIGTDACSVAFALDFEFDSPWLTRAAGGLFENACNRMVDAFVQRALDASPHRPPAV